MGYVNVHGKPINVSARGPVRAIHPEAVSERVPLSGRIKVWRIRKTKSSIAWVIGSGANEEAAWRDAWSRMLADDLVKEGWA